MFPKKLSSEVKDLIRRLMHKNPAQRLGHRNGVDDILAHVWFKGLDLNDYIQKKVPPPYIPDLTKIQFR